MLLPATSWAWLPGFNPLAVPSRGFTVDSTNRNEVVSFWQAIYQASEGYRDRMAWSGDYSSVATGAEGTVSAAFVADTERRLNFVRALCGVPGNVTLNSGAVVSIQDTDSAKPDASTTKSAAAQRSAFMISRSYTGTTANYGLSHDPPSNCVAWTPAAWNANHNGNVAQGFYGPTAIDAFVQETAPGLSAWNVDVGHRRWTLMQRATDYATGNSPGLYTPSTNKVIPPASTLYVTQKTSEINFDFPAKFVSYPAAGYFPAALNSSYWSLSYPYADFSAAKVTVTDASGAAVAATVVSRSALYADNTLVWRMPSAASVQDVSADTKYNVSVTGIAGDGIPSSYSYSVTLIDPDQINQVPVLSGSATPSSEGSAYGITVIPSAESTETSFFLRHAAAWTEGGENSPEPQVIPHTSPAYAFLDSTSGYARTGSQSFRLALPPYDVLINGVPEQSFELDREILPGAGAQLKYYYRRGYMTSGSHMAVEGSTDQGAHWTSLAADIAGSGTNQPDNGFTEATVTLPASGVPMHVRFRMFYVSGGYYAYDNAAKPNGIFIDDITSTGCDVLEKTGTVVTTGATSVTFSSTTTNRTLLAGQEWWLRERAILGGHPFPYGPALIAHPVQALQLSGRSDPPAGGGANYAFVPVSSADSYTLQVSPLTPANWTEGAETSPAPQVQDDTSASYDLLSTKAGYFSSGARSFRIGLATTTDTDDSFTILRSFTAADNTSLSFWIRKGTMAASNTVSAEVSEDGTNWTSVWSVPGKTTADAAGATQTASLAAFAGKELKVRFIVRKGATNNMAWNASNSGAWFDDIKIVNGWSSSGETDTTVSASSALVRLDAKSAGQPLQATVPVRMRLQANRSGGAAVSGPYFVAVPTGTPVTGFAGWLAYDYPDLQQGFAGDDDGDGLSNGLEYAFGLNPLQAATFTQTLTVGADDTLRMAQPLAEMKSGIAYGAEWSSDMVNWSSEGVSVALANGQVVATAPKGTKSRFLRWKISEN